MTLRDLLKKKEKVQDGMMAGAEPSMEAAGMTHAEKGRLPQASEFTFMRTDTNTQDIIQPPGIEGEHVDDADHYEDDNDRRAANGNKMDPFSQLDEQTSETSREQASPPSSTKKRFSRLRNKSASSSMSTTPEAPSTPPREHKRLSERLHLHRKSSSVTSTNLPSDLPDIPEPYSDHTSHGYSPAPSSHADPSEEMDEETARKKAEKEAQWEQRATLLASAQAGKVAGRSSSSNRDTPRSDQGQTPSRSSSQQPNSRSRSVSDAQSDVNIQEAIRLHEAGDLVAATQMFHTLAERGNVLSQVLYGLSLRHGWGCSPNLPLAVQYLSEAAQNSATIESEALKAGLKKGGAAKGELVLAIFELGNCFRYGWGVQIDKVAARQYYETAANLGDTDAMNEAAWCYLEGFGGKKDKFKAAQLLRMAENNGSKILGNSWIWKEKYNAK